MDRHGAPDRESVLARFLRDNYGDAVAVDMEGFGVLEAAHQRKVAALVVRGISDLLSDKAERDRWLARFAMRSSSRRHRGASGCELSGLL